MGMAGSLLGECMKLLCHPRAPGGLIKEFVLVKTLVCYPRLEQ